MKILVVGAGVVGSIFGWALTKSGHEVTHFVRPGRADRLAKGMPVDVLDRRPHYPEHVQEIYPIRASESIAGFESYDLVIVPTKHYTLESTLQQIAPLTRGVDTLLLTQNWQGTIAINHWLDPNHYIFGDAKAGGNLNNGSLTCALKAIDIGTPDVKPNDCLTQFVELFKDAKIPVHVQDQMMPYLWIQYAITGGLWPGLVRAGSFKNVLHGKQNKNLIFNSVRECLTVVEARGVNLAQFPSVEVYLNPTPITKWLASLAMTWMFTFDEYQKRCSLHALADPQEVHTFYYDLLNTGHELGVPMPAFEQYQPDMEHFTQPGQAW